MYRIDNQSAVAVMPTIGSAGPHPNSYFKRASGIATATRVSVDFLNSIQEEVCYLIENTGITLDKENNTQLLEAINIIIADNPLPPEGGDATIIDTNNFGIYAIDEADPDSGTTTLEIESSNNIVVTPADGLYMLSNHWIGTDFADIEYFTTNISINGFILNLIGNLAIYRGAGLANTVVLTQAAFNDLIDITDSELSNIQYIYGYLDSSISSSSTVYLWKGLESASNISYPVAYPTFTTSISYVLQFDVWVDVAPGVGESFEISLMRVGVSTLIANPLTISGTNTSGTISAGFADADNQWGTRVAIKVVTSSGAATLTRINYRIKIQNAAYP